MQDTCFTLVVGRHAFLSVVVVGLKNDRGGESIIYHDVLSTRLDA